MGINQNGIEKFNNSVCQKQGEKRQKKGNEYSKENGGIGQPYV